MTRNVPHWIAPTLRYLLLCGAVLYIVVYLSIAFFRLGYPFELEWMEGATVDHVSRILSGQPLYVSPSLAFTPHNYPPLYYYVSAIVASLVGVSFLPLRLVSFAASIGCFIVIFLIVRRETGSLYAGVLASGLFAATFRIGGAWFEVARIDMLFLVLLLVALYWLRGKASFKYGMLAGLFVALAFLTKQTALAIAIPLMLYTLCVNWQYALGFIATMAGLIGGSTLILDYLHAGWYRYYVFALPTQHAVRHPQQWIGFWQKDIFLPLGITVGMALFFLVSRFRAGSTTQGLFYLSATLGVFGGAWFSRVHAGAYNNTLLPAYALLAILFGLALHDILNTLYQFSPTQRTLMTSYVYLIGLIQFGALLYHPVKQLPTAQDLRAGNRLIAMIAAIQGEILFPRHGYLPTLAGKQSAAQEIAINDILRCDDRNATTRRSKQKLQDEITDALVNQRFQAIILDHQGWFPALLNQYYVLQRRVFDDEDVFWPVTGYRTRPEFIYVPRRP